MPRKPRDRGTPNDLVHMFYLSGYLLAKGQIVRKIVIKTSSLVEQVAPHIVNGHVPSLSGVDLAGWVPNPLEFALGVSCNVMASFDAKCF
ncbi:hypothetical protein Hte_004948 [Hypoxylon texense]